VHGSPGTGAIAPAVCSYNQCKHQPLYEPYYPLFGALLHAVLDISPASPSHIPAARGILAAVYSSYSGIVRSTAVYLLPMQCM